MSDKVEYLIWFYVEKCSTPSGLDADGCRMDDQYEDVENDEFPVKVAVLPSLDAVREFVRIVRVK